MHARARLFGPVGVQRTCYGQACAQIMLSAAGLGVARHDAMLTSSPTVGALTTRLVVASCDDGVKREVVKTRSVTFLQLPFAVAFPAVPGMQVDRLAFCAQRHG